MMNFYDSNPDEMNLDTSPSPKLKGKKSLLKSIFEFYWVAYYRTVPEEKSFYTQKIHAIFAAITWFLQMASLLWIPTLSISDWHKNRYFWHIIGFARLDNLCSALGVINFCIYASIVAIMINGLLLMFPIVLIYKSLKIFGLWYKIYKKNSYFLANYLVVPLFTLLALCLKYNFQDKEKHLNYEESNMEDLKVNVTVQILIIFCLILGAFIILMNALFSGEIRHSMAKYRLKAKAYSENEFWDAIFKLSLPIMYAMLSDSYIEYFQLFLMLASVVLLIKTLMNIPYFSFFMNCLNTIKFCVISCLSCQFLFGKLLDSSIIIILFTFTVMPLFCIFSVKLLRYRIKKIDSKIPSNPKRFENLYDLELCLRHYLCLKNAENAKEIFILLGKCCSDHKLYKNKLLAIWEVNYCIFSLNDNALAKIKLSKTRNSDFSWEGSYQEYASRKTLSEANSNDGSDYLDYFHKFNDYKLEDEILCIKLLDFWKEIVSVKPNLQSLNKFLTSISETFTYLEKECSELSKSFPKCKEPLILYSSFVKNILLDLEKATVFECKAKSIEKFSITSAKDLKNFNHSDENVGLILASAEKEDFGNIIYANSKSGEFLKSSIDWIIGNNIVSLIPPAYKEFFNKSICDLLLLTNSSNINLPESGFLALSDGYIIECTVRLSIACFSDKLIFILLFQPKSTSSQCALLSQNWEISAHSEKFSSMISTNQRDLSNLHISQIFPSLPYMSMEPSKLYHIPSSKSGTHLEYCILEIFNIKIPYILLINDPSEIEKWKRENSYEIQPCGTKNLEKQYNTSCAAQFPVSNQQILKKIHFSRQNSAIKENTFKNNAQPVDSTHDDIAKEKNLDIVKNSVKSDSFCQPLVFNRIRKLSSRSINIFHIVLILSMVIAISTNLIIFFYISTKVTEESSIEVYTSLGKLQEIYLSVTYYARGISVSEYFHGPAELLEYSYQNYYAEFAVLEDLYKKILSNLLEWQSGSVNVFIEESNKLWSTNGKIHLEYTSLINTVSEFLTIGKSFIKKQISHEDNTKELQFFSMNGYWESFRYCNASLYSLIDSKMEDIDSLEYQMSALSTTGFGVLLVCLVIISLFCVSVIGMENKFWNLIQKNAYNSYPELKKACIERLEKVHKKAYIVYDDRKISIKSNFKNYWKYIWRVGVYLLIAILFYFLNSHLYRSCSSLLHLRPTLLRDIINAKVSYKALIIWSGEVTQLNIPQSLTVLLAENYPFPNLKTQFEEAFQSFSYPVKQIRDKKYSPLLSDDFIDIFYENFPNSNHLLDYGIYSAGNAIAFESLVFSHANMEDIIEVGSNIFMQLNELNDKLDLLIDLADKDSQNVIKFQLELIIVSWASFVFSSLALYFWCYLPFFDREKKILEKLNVIAKIIPHKPFK